jgi:hypothetical protein
MSPVSHLRLAGLDGRLATSIANRSKCESADEATRGISTVAASASAPDRRAPFLRPSGGMSTGQTLRDAPEQNPL